MISPDSIFVRCCGRYGLALLLSLTCTTSLFGQTPVDTLLGLQYRYYDQPVDAERYLIRPQENITVNFLGTKLAPLNLTITAEGRLVDPALGAFDLAGKTLADARDMLSPRIKQAYMADRIEITIGRPYQIAVALTGAVSEPGWYIGYTSNLVSELIEFAGGILPSGSRRHIQFIGGPETITVDLDRAMYLGEWAANPPLYAGYRIHVPQRSDRSVHIVGEVLQPREIELRDSDSLGLLLDMAGGITVEGDAGKVFLTEEPDSPVALDLIPEPGQVIVVPGAQQQQRGAVSVFGAVARPGRYPLASAGSLAALLAAAGDPDETANTSRITVFREAPEATGGAAQRVRYPISVGEATETFQLFPHDSVFVPELIGFVRVDGWVRNPGLVPWSRGKTVQYYIDLAGGYLEDADREQMVVSDRVSRLSHVGGPGSAVGDGDQISVRRKEIGN